MTDHVVASVEEAESAERLVVEIRGREFGIFEVNGEYRAYLNWCPHQGAPICEGPLGGELVASYDRETLELDLEWTKEGKILTCPWHGFEFDLTTSECLGRESLELPAYPVREEDGELILEM